jgi:hypothetical protein
MSMELTPIALVGRFITPQDLAPFADIEPVKAAAMIADAETMAVLVAPRLDTLEADSPHIASVRAVLRGAILRWHESGSGAITQTAVGQISQTIAPRRSIFWPSEIEQLRSIGDDTDTDKAFAVDTAPSLWSHSPICSVYFGAACSCGYDIALEPIYEVE